MKRPSFQFYPGDYRANAKLRRCTHAERGIWIDVMCLFHDSEEYGVLRWPLQDIALAVNCRLPEIRPLVSKGVLKGSDDAIEALIYTPRHAGKDGEPVILLPQQAGPIWYSSRMVRDEYVRTVRGESTRFREPNGAPKAIPTTAPNPTPKEPPMPPIGDGASASASASERSIALSGKPDLKSVAVNILQFLNEKAGKAYRDVPANVDLIKARLREGYTATDLRQVIVKKSREWMADDKMREFLRPKTLFNRTNFASYAGELVDGPTTT